MNSPVLVVGHVTHDLINDQVRLGGAAAYIAQALSACGQEVALVTRAPNEPLLQPLSSNPRIHLHRLASDTITTFRHHFEKGQRQLSLDACAADITVNDIPSKWRNLPLVFLVPVIGECRLELLSAFPESELIVGMQGWLRTVSTGGRIKPSEPPEALLTVRMLAVTLSAEDHPEANAFAKRMAEHCRLIALTRGEQAITIYEKLGQSNIPVKPVQHVHDTNGAGDVFTALLGLRIMAGNPVNIAVSQAAQGTARYVEKGMTGLSGI
jgi:sugar/nucleoside kinase (ribokinase family)